MVSLVLVNHHFLKKVVILKFKNKDINECSTNNGGCSSNAKCTNNVGSFSCACNDGYSGDGFTCNGNHFRLAFSFFLHIQLNNENKKIDVNECLTNNGGCHATLATCTNTVGSRTCACNTGYTGDGITCSGNEFLTFVSISKLKLNK